jgi:predicted adenylyl cyclase CyaB
MREIQIKVLEIERAPLELRLKALGATLQFDDTVSALLFDTPGGLVGGARNLLRLRREGRRVVLTFKEHIANGPVKIRNEHETEVRDFEAMCAVLRHLGLHPVLSIEKHRTTYELGGARFSFDRHTGDLSYVPELLEIEADSKERLIQNAARLGFEPAECLPWGLPELIAHYGSPVSDH